MLNKIYRVVIAMVLLIGITNAKPLEEKAKLKGYDIVLFSKKSLTVGSNTLYASVKKNGAVVKDMKVKIKIFMPEMAGMAFMENKKYGKFDGEVHKININFFMSGTWQYFLYFKLNDGTKFKIRGAINL